MSLEAARNSSHPSCQDARSKSPGLNLIENRMKNTKKIRLFLMMMMVVITDMRMRTGRRYVESSSLKDGGKLSLTLE